MVVVDGAGEERESRDHSHFLCRFEQGFCGAPTSIWAWRRRAIECSCFRHNSESHSSAAVAEQVLEKDPRRTNPRLEE